MRTNKGSRKARRQRGAALVTVLFGLMLVSALSLGMMYMAATETNISSNYRAEQQAYFAATAGLEEARDRMWMGNLKDMSGHTLTLPTVLPTLANNGVIYLTNPSAKDGSVHPWDPNSPYFDDELCHEGYAALNMADPGVGTRCAAGSLPSGSNWYTEVPSTAPYTGTDAALAYKWVRITVKNNRAANPYYVDGTGVSTNVVCWNPYWSQEELLARKGQPASPIRDINPEVQLAKNTRNWFQRAFDAAFDPPVAYAYDKAKSSGNSSGNGNNGNGNGNGNSSSGSSSSGSSSSGSSSSGSSSSGSSGSSSGMGSSGSSGSSSGMGSSSSSDGSSSSGSSGSGSDDGDSDGDGEDGSGSSGSGSSSSGSSSGSATPTYCEDPAQAFPRKAVYTVTALAKTTSGGRKMVQYELANNLFQTPPAPAPLTVIGPTPSFGSANSNNFTIAGTDAHQGKDGSGNGTCTGPVINTDAIIASGSTEATSIAGALKRPDHYTGTSAAPDVKALSTSGANWKDINFLNAMVSSLRDQAQSAGRYYSTFSNGAAPSNFGTTAAPLFTFVDGNVTASSGAGLLVVTGDFNANGNFSWSGTILVIGDGSFNINGGGNGQISGGVVVAKTGSLDSSGSPTKLIPSNTLGVPSFNWNGGGGNGMQWDSCWANVMNGTNGNYYKVLSFRETMY